jgi:hypothetical protein
MEENAITKELEILESQLAEKEMLIGSKEMIKLRQQIEPSDDGELESFVKMETLEEIPEMGETP